MNVNVIDPQSRIVGRHQITLDVSLFAYDQQDAEKLAAMLRDRVESLLGGGQAIVRATNVKPVTGPGLFNQQ